MGSEDINLQGEGTSHEPAQISGLLNLPSRGLFSDGIVSKRYVSPYIATHDKTKAPPDQTVSTDSSKEAFIRMLKRRNAPAAAGGTGKKGTAGGASGAKRVHDAAGTKEGEQQPKKKPALGLASALTPLSKPAAPSSMGGAQQPHAATGAGTSRAPSSNQPAHASSTDEPGPSTKPAAAGSKKSAAQPAGHQAAAAAPATGSLFTATGAQPPRAAAAALAAAVASGHAAGAAAAGPAGAGGGARRTFTQDELKSKAVKDLKVRGRA